jgi:hypothetical protein
MLVLSSGIESSFFRHGNNGVGIRSEGWIGRSASALGAAFARIDVMTAMPDGKPVALTSNGLSSFPELQVFLSEAPAAGCTSTCLTCCT